MLKQLNTPFLRWFFAGTLIAVAAFGVYSNTLRNGFVWDDHSLLEKNEFVQEWSNFGKIASLDYFTRVPPLEVANGARPAWIAITPEPNPARSAGQDYPMASKAQAPPLPLSREDSFRICSLGRVAKGEKTASNGITAYAGMVNNTAAGCNAGARRADWRIHRSVPTPAAGRNPRNRG